MSVPELEENLRNDSKLCMQVYNIEPTKPGVKSIGFEIGCK